MKPRIFVSAVSKELRSARQIIANTLMAIGYEPVWQDIFGLSSEDIRPMLREKIDSCSAVIQIIGDAYGAEPSAPDESFGRVSYTQYEALYAHAKKKPVYYLLAQDNSPRDVDPLTIDQPLDESETARADADERRALQRKYRESVQATEHIYYAVQSHTETELTIRRLKDELNRLRRGFRSWMIAVSVGLAFIAAAVTWIMLGLPGLSKSIREAEERTAIAIKELSSPTVLADRIRKEIQAAAEKKIEALTQEKGRAKDIAQVETERDLAIGRVDDLVKLIQEGLKEGASEVFERAAEILEKEGTDQALDYLESRRDSVLTTAKRHIELAGRAAAQAQAEKELRNKSLEALILESDLLEVKLKWEESIRLQSQVAELAPDWFKVRRRLGSLLQSLARYPESEPHFREALHLAANPEEETEALGDLAILLKKTNRVVAAELFTRRALLIDEKVHGNDHQHIARDLNILASFLQDAGRNEDGETLLRRALEIDEKYSDYEARSNAAAVLGNLAHSFFRTNRFEEAQLLLRRALAIEEENEGPGSKNAGIVLGNLSHLLDATNRMEDAEPVVYHGLKIQIRRYGEAHPNVANALNNLGRWLQNMNRTEESEMLFRRALINAEKVLGSDDLNLAYHLNNLARLFDGKKEYEKAEPLMRRSVEIFRLFEINTGRMQPNSQNGIDFYRDLLGRMKYPQEQIDKLVESASNPKGPLEPIVPEMERLLGPTKTTGELMSDLNNRYTKENRASIYFLAPEKPIAKLLHEFLKPTAAQRNGDAWQASADKRFADAIVIYDEALSLIKGDEPNKLLPTLIRMNRAISLREFGDFTQASLELQKIVDELEQNPAATPEAKGAVLYHRAVCEWRLGNIEAANSVAEASLKAYGEHPSRRAAENLIATLKANKPPPSPPPGDREAQLDAAKVRLKNLSELATLSTKESISPVLEKILGPAIPVEEVLSKLDEQYRKEGKPEFWFIPIDQPLGPHLDKILGPLPTREPANAG